MIGDKMSLLNMLGQARRAKPAVLMERIDGEWFKAWVKELASQSNIPLPSAEQGRPQIYGCPVIVSSSLKRDEVLLTQLSNYAQSLLGVADSERIVILHNIPDLWRRTDE